MRISRTESARRAGSGAHAGRTAGARSPGPAAGRGAAARGPWAVVCAVVTVVLGPAAVTASALDRANAAPRHHTARADGPRAYATGDPARQSSLNRSHSLG
ncbi:hypothetical protein F8144_33980 [Streptomyces triticiradicis]|uniref:Uncharacterized protein n=1 Tax=Streptomyces triticiradicis TaxID=2651189 RepID=A0A7J5D7I4_9ACTN|nr:hypothetical protein F8144_33980 [Streptomyces triticiradicis]